MIDPKLIDKAIRISRKNKYDIVTNVFPRTFPKGQSVEIIKTSILKRYSENFTKADREHVTKYFYNNSNKFKVKNFTFEKKVKIVNLSVDTRKDLNQILKNFSKKKFKTYSIKI